MTFSANKRHLTKILLVLILAACKQPTTTIGRSISDEEGKTNLPTPYLPPPEDPHEEEKNTISQAHLGVIKQYCISCHTGYHTSWSNYDTDQQWIHSGLVVKDNAEASLLVLFSKYNGINASGTMPKVDNGWSAAEAKILIDWINNMSKSDLLATPKPTPSPSSTQSTGSNPAPSPTATSQPPVSTAPGDFYRGSNDSLPMLGSTSVASLLTSVFGPNSANIVLENITKRRTYFGGSCDARNDYLLCSSTNADNFTHTLGHRYGSTSGREGYRAKACKSLHFDDTTLNYALDQVQPTASRLSPPTDLQINKLYQLFYPGIEVPTNILARLRDVKNSAASISVKDSWRYVLLTICFSPDWQIN